MNISLVLLFGLLIGITSTNGAITSMIDNFPVPRQEMAEEHSELSAPIMKREADVPEVSLYYECMCPGCRRFYPTVFFPTVKELSQFIDVKTYPYGKASTTVNYDGNITFECQHGPAECNGNMLHACVLEHKENRALALEVNACLMEVARPENGSNVESLRQCGKQRDIDTKPIEECVAGKEGIELYKRIGEESVKANYRSLPHIVINGEVLKTEEKNDLKKAICAAFKNPPPVCNQAQPA